MSETQRYTTVHPQKSEIVVSQNPRFPIPRIREPFQKVACFEMSGDQKPTIELVCQLAKREPDKLRETLKENPYFDVNQNDGTWTPLIYAVTYNHPESVRLLIKHGADVQERGDSIWSPLHFAAYKNFQDCAEILLEAGADPKNEGAVHLFFSNTKKKGF